MAIKIVKRAPPSEAAPLVKGAIAAEKVRSTDAPPVQAQVPQSKVPEVDLSTSAFYQQLLKKNPDQAARYAEALKKPIGERAVKCKHCPGVYVIVCETKKELDECMNYKWRQERLKAEANGN